MGLSGMEVSALRKVYVVIMPVNQVCYREETDQIKVKSKQFLVIRRTQKQGAFVGNRKQWCSLQMVFFGQGIQGRASLRVGRYHSQVGCC